MVDLMDLLRDVLVCSLQVWMLNDFGKNMFPYRVGSLWKRIGVYFAAALCIFIANHMGTTLFNITIIPVSYTIAAIIIFQGSKWKKVIYAIIAIVGTITGNWIGMFSFLLPFTILRQYAGGIHLEKPMNCIIFSGFLVFGCGQYLAVASDMTCENVCVDLLEDKCVQEKR